MSEKPTSPAPRHAPPVSERGLDDCLRMLGDGLDTRPTRYKMLSMLERLQTDPMTLYTLHEIPKKSGGMREIYAPAEELKDLQRFYLRAFMNLLRRSPYACAFQIGMNAQIALRQGLEWVESAEDGELRAVHGIDLKDFFPSIGVEQVERAVHDAVHRLLCRRRNNGPEVARVIAHTYAQLCCLKGSLIQGPPTSPVAADLVAAPMDRAIANELDQDTYYFRYADDLTRLSRKPMDEKAQKVAGHIARSMGFTVNDKKTVYGENRTDYEVLGMKICLPETAQGMPLRFKLTDDKRRMIEEEGWRLFKDDPDVPATREDFLKYFPWLRVHGLLEYASYVTEMGDRRERDGDWLALPSGRGGLSHLWKSMRQAWADRLPQKHPAMFLARGSTFQDQSQTTPATAQTLEERIDELCAARGLPLETFRGEVQYLKASLNARYNRVVDDQQCRGDGTSYPDTDRCGRIEKLAERFRKPRSQRRTLERDLREEVAWFLSFAQSQFDGTMQGYPGNGGSLLPRDLREPWEKLLEAVRGSAHPDLAAGLDALFPDHQTVTTRVRVSGPEPIRAPSEPHIPLRCFDTDPPR